MATIADKVQIYLRSTSPDENGPTWTHALSIPHDAIRRLSLRPLKWLRFATFAVCGAKGDLRVNATEDDGLVDYDNVSFDNLAPKYYYFPEGDYHFVDPNVLSGRAFRKSDAFNQRVCERDSNRCVFCSEDAPICDAAHIIPERKGNKYITLVMRDRASLYEPSSFLDERASEDDINHVQNGILIRCDLHTKFCLGKVVFLKTPNFALEPADMPVNDRGYHPITGESRITVQYLDAPPSDRFCAAQLHNWTSEPHWSNKETSPPNILLDFMYGAAILKYWMNGDLVGMLRERTQNFATASKESEYSIPRRRHLYSPR